MIVEGEREEVVVGVEELGASVTRTRSKVPAASSRTEASADATHTNAAIDGCPSLVRGGSRQDMFATYVPDTRIWDLRLHITSQNRAAQRSALAGCCTLWHTTRSKQTALDV